MKRERGRTAGEMSVLAVTSGVVCAVPASSVARLAEVEGAPARPPARRTHPALLGTVDVAGESLAAWDLSRLLALPPDEEAAAWMVLALEGLDGPRRLALRLSRCLSVLPLSIATVFPSPLFRMRPGAIRGAFLVPQPHAELSPLGLFLEPADLLDAAEMLLGAAAAGERSA